MKMESIRWCAAVAIAASCLLTQTLNGQTSLQFTNIRMLTNKEVALSIQYTNGANYRVSTSSDLFDWANMLTFTGNVSSLSFTDSAAPYLNPRIYRAEKLTNGFALTGDHLTTTNGDVVIRPLYHASFVMKWQDKIIYNDPDTINPSPYPSLPKADLILVSHAHGDHFDVPTLTSLTNTNTVIIVSRIVYASSSLNSSLRAISIQLTNGMSTNVMGLNVEAVPAYNIPPFPINHVKGDGNGYVLTIGGKRLYMAGDTSDVLEMRNLQNIDVAFLPMNYQFTMSVTNAADAVRQFRPAVVYPYHYSGSPAGDVNDFKRRVGQDLGIEVRLRKWY
jgi:L-ascorbate metabolism protein UlaG (beta-lactamase superfamily)